MSGRMKTAAKIRARTILWIRQDGLCAICGRAIKAIFPSSTPGGPDPLSVTIDHVISRARGGNNELENLRLACYRCNHLRSLRGL